MARRSAFQMISIVIADDHGIVREGIRRLLESESNLEVCSEASDGREVLEQFKVRSLSAREREMLHLIAEGLSAKEAAV